MHRLIALLTLLVALPAGAISIDWVYVGDAGNSPDTEIMNDGTTGYGSVPYAYYISKYEVTIEQYVEFLNAVDPTGAGGLLHYNPDAIDRVAANPSGSKYVVKSGFSHMPANDVSFYDALRFANWLNNGQGSGDTETGAYTLLGGTATPSNGSMITRNPGAQVFLTSEDEWYKAAFYDALSASYFNLPTGTGVSCSRPTGLPQRANCGELVGTTTPVGSYPNSPSAYGTFDQAGNVWEWNESIIPNPFLGPLRGNRGGWFGDGPDGIPALMAARDRSAGDPPGVGPGVGFRVASLVPEPGTGLLLMTGLLGLAARRTRRK